MRQFLVLLLLAPYVAFAGMVSPPVTAAVTPDTKKDDIIEYAIRVKVTPDVQPTAVQWYTYNKNLWGSRDQCVAALKTDEIKEAVLELSRAVTRQVGAVHVEAECVDLKTLIPMAPGPAGRGA